MYIRPVIAFFYLFPLLVFAQPIERERINITDENGLKQGKWEVAFENSNFIRYKGQFNDDMPFGKFKYYYLTGEVSVIMIFMDQNVAKAKIYHKNGNLLSMGKYINQKKDSIWWYFNDRKEILNMESYSNGLLNGEQINYYPGDPSKEKIIVLERYTCINGQKNGDWEQYYKSGRIKSKGTYLNDYLSGSAYYYSSDEKLELKAEYIKGHKQGCWLYYRKDGELFKRIYYKEDRKNGIFSEWFENGKLKYEGNYTDDLLDGCFMYYDEDGEILKRVYYKNDRKLEGKELEEYKKNIISDK